MLQKSGVCVYGSFISDFQLIVFKPSLSDVKLSQTTTKQGPCDSFICVVDVRWRHTRDSYFAYFAFVIKVLHVAPNRFLPREAPDPPLTPADRPVCDSQQQRTAAGLSSNQRPSPHRQWETLTACERIQRAWPTVDDLQTSQSHRRAAMLIILAFIILFHLAAAILLFGATIHNVSIGREGTHKRMAVQERLNHLCVPPWCRRGGWCQLPDVMWSTPTCGTPVTPPAILWRTAILLKQVRQDVCVKNCLNFHYLLLNYIFLLCWGIICQTDARVLNIKGSSTNLTYQNVLTALEDNLQLVV